MFDTSHVVSEVSVMVSEQMMCDRLFRNRYVKVTNSSDNKTFIGRVVAGPFFAPEEVAETSAVAFIPILRGMQETVPYYSACHVEILGEYDGSLRATATRPLPNSDVYALTKKEIVSLIGIGGDLNIGELSGYEDIFVQLNSESKDVFPRHIGIFGTSGSGKSTTEQTLVELLAERGWAVVLIDVEGEFVHMDKPQVEETLIEVLKKKYKEKPAGIARLKVYHPHGSDSPRKDSTEFSIRFDEMDLEILFEIIRATEAQQRDLGQLIDDLRQQFGYQSSTDVGARVNRIISGKKTKRYTLQDAMDVVNEMGTRTVLPAKLRQIDRYQIFDQESSEVHAKDFLKNGQVNVIDVSTVGDAVKNIVIAYVLREVFKEKIREPISTPKTFVVIEEAHTFVAKEAAEQMTATLDLLKLISRRGRKRWLGLCFTSQQPGDLPPQIFELCNTRFIHQTKSQYNMDILKRTTGGVTSDMWNIVPLLSKGEAIITSPALSHPIMAKIRPPKSLRKFTE
jgi:DNA helicase HerA-like ATPase